MIDWEEQWASFAEGFRDGKAHIDLAKFGASGILQLLPGAGFGDLSHSTTFLMLQLMSSRIQGKKLIDIGCGSGILTLAAKMMGASSAHGIDIEADAIAHAQKNAILNHIDATFSLTTEKKNYDVALMNMISSEQKIAMKHAIKAPLWITSGILEEQLEDYLELTRTWGWQLIAQESRLGWLALVFTSQ